MADRNRTGAAALILTTIAALWSPTVNAIVIRHDRQDAQYRAAPSEFPFYVHVMGQVGGTLVAPQWVLTAAHTVEGVDPLSDWRVFIAGTRYDVSKIILLPGRQSGDVNAENDVALLKLAKPVSGVRLAPLYRRSDEMDKQGVIIGRGSTGTGRLDGPAPLRDGILRRAEITVQGAYGNVLLTVFRAPPRGNDLEGDSEQGDSGGPLLIKDGSSWHVAGINSTSSHPGIKGTHYETLSAYARVSAFAKWIDATIAADAPSTLQQWPPLTRADSLAAAPQTPCIRIAAAFLEAGRSQDPEILVRFMRDHTSRTAKSPPEERAQFWSNHFHQAGAQSFYGYTALGADQLTIVTRTTDGRWLAYLFQVSKADTSRLEMLVSGDLPGPPTRHETDGEGG